MLYDVMYDEPSKMSFLLNEEFFDYYSGRGAYNNVIKFYLYVNPTPDEMRKYICVGARGWASPQGDIYLEGQEEINIGSAIHEEIIMALKRKIPNIVPESEWGFYDNLAPFTKKCGKYGILVQRVKNSNIIGLSESTRINQYNQGQLRKIIKNFKVKNPNLEFDINSVAPLSDPDGGGYEED